MKPVQIYTIGFTQKTAEDFFASLLKENVKRVIDVRLNNVSQLAGFSKKDDLRYFLKTICGMDYAHLPALAPTQELLDRYKKHKSGWAIYECDFLRLMDERKIEDIIPRAIIDGGCLLCSEPTPERCHRRLVAEYLRDRWKSVEIIHL